MRRPLVLALLALLASLCLPALAHDMWLVPPTGAAVGAPVEVVVSVGMDFPTSVSAMTPERLTVTAHGPGVAKSDVVLRKEEEAKRTVATFTPEVAGVWVVSGVTRPNRLDLTAEEFNHYLLHDGMPHVLHERMDRGELDRDATERYSKYVKAIVPIGDGGSGEAARRVLGLKLEIVPQTDPLAVEVGDTLPVRVLFDGKPLEHANLCWDHPGNGEDFTGQTWTDAQGRALVPIGKRGPTTLRLVHMTRPVDDEVEWESFWGSLTFHVK